MAFRDAMELAQSSSMSWEDQVQEEQRCSTMEGGPNPGLSPLPLEGDIASNVSMVDDSLLQWDSTVVIEEEREESMDTDIPISPPAPCL